MKTLLTILLTLFMAVPAFAGDFDEVVTPDKVFEAGYIQVIGESGEGQKRRTANIAARVAAQARMAEIVNGVQVSGTRTIKDGKIKEIIVSKIGGKFKGAVVSARKYDETTGVAVVAMRMPLRGEDSLYSIFGPMIKKDPKAFGITPKTAYSGKDSAVVKMGPPKDGLIVDARGLNFKPALVNRILSPTGELVFGPDKVVQNALVDRGCGGFTTTMEKARGMLALWGGKNPLVVKAQSVSDLTDLMVSAGDAAAIHAGNSKNGFLAQARVVFVLK